MSLFDLLKNYLCRREKEMDSIPDETINPILAEFRRKAIKRQRRIVMPETAFIYELNEDKDNPDKYKINDTRVLEAAEKARKDKLAHIILLGNAKKIQEYANDQGLNEFDIGSYDVVDPLTSNHLTSYAEQYFELRSKNKDMTLAKAEEAIKMPLFYGAMMVRQGHADGMLAGSIATTGEVYSAAIKVIGTKDGLASAVFYMMLAEGIETGAEVNGRHVLAYADGVVNPKPTIEERARIGIDTAKTFYKLFGVEPCVAFLSHSTKGSGDESLARPTRDAAEIAKKLEPSIKIDGELQGDAALVQAIGDKKAPSSEVAGKANVLIFPDIDAGNIAYKLTERAGGARAIGPVSQGLKKPVNDLSRGCSVEDIIDMIAITSLLAE